MAPRAPKPKPEEGTSEVLKPKTEKAKVEKAKAEPKPKVKAEKTEKAPKVTKPRVEKGEKAEKKEKSDGKGSEKGGEKGTKEKVKPVTGDEAAALIVEYLKVMNRPFSATEVSANLHGRVTKTVADKLLKELGEKKTISMSSTNKDAKGSQFVFWTLQDHSDTATPEELAAMDSTISSLKSSNPTLKSTLKVVSTKLATLKSAPSTMELEAMVDKLRVENAAKAKKLHGFKSGQVKQVSKEEMVRAEKEYKFWGLKRRLRKAAYESLEDVFLGIGKGREEIREEAGVEVDE